MVYGSNVGIDSENNLKTVFTRSISSQLRIENIFQYLVGTNFPHS